jgi:DNA-binding CsgD family transcriptional regulator
MLHARRTAGSIGSEAALEAWRALTEGKWSVLETVESDGKRFLVARRNALEIGDTAATKALEDLERQICAMTAAGHTQKLIAYELGIHPASVARRLRTGMIKLRVRTRAELARHFAWVPVASR